MFEVIYENSDFLVLNKPAGVLVHPVARCKSRSANRDEETIVDWLLRYYPEVKGVGDLSAGSWQALRQCSGQAPSAGSRLRQATDGQAGQDPSTSSGRVMPERPGIVHRLDRDTSGVLLVARTQPFFEYMKRLFQAHEVEKTYLALVHGRVKGCGVIDTPIGLRAGSVKRSPVPKQSFGTGRSVRARHMKMVKEAITEYRPLKVFERLGDGELFTLVELTPRTGRTHQLRVHMASIGHPVAGDELYGRKGNPLGLPRHFLHAASLEFSLPAQAGLPDGKRMRFDAELPDDLKHAMNGLQEVN